MEAGDAVETSPHEEHGRERTALVLGGGGNLGALEVGFVRRVAELGIELDFVVGTSVGALNAAHVVFHDDPGHDCLYDIWSELSRRRLFHRSIPRIVLNLLRTRMSLYDDSFVRELVADHLPVDDFEAARVPLHITATNLRTGSRHIFSEGSVLQAILASSAIPGVFPPVTIGNDVFVDGGVTAPTDIDAAIELGATNVIAVDLRPGITERAPEHIVDVLFRSLELLAESRSVCAVEHAGHQANVVHIQPGISVESPSDFREVDRMLEQSYSMACGVFDQCWDGERFRAGSYRLTAPVS